MNFISKKKLILNSLLIMSIYFAQGCSSDEEVIQVKSLSISQSSAIVNEGDAAFIQVILDKPLENDLFFELEITGEAKLYDDIRFTAGNSYFINAGETNFQIEYIAVEDSTVELEESATIKLVNFQSADKFEVGNNAFDLTIIDNDQPAILDFESPSVYVGDRNQISKSVRLIFDRVIKDEVEIEFSISGTATRGKDYEVVSDMNLVLAEGDREVSLDFEIYADSEKEFDETIIISASIVNGIDAIMSENNTSLITIYGELESDGTESLSGLYAVIESKYFRIGVENYPWNGELRFIAKTGPDSYENDGYLGPFGFEGARVAFTLNTDDSIIPYLTTTPFGEVDAKSCEENGELFVNVSCNNSNVVIRDNVNGEHLIYMTYGYNNPSTDASGGMREFYEVLRKLP